MDYTNQWKDQEINEYGLIYEIDSLYDYFQRITDPRSKLGKQYALNTILVWMILAKLGGQDKPSGIAEWVAHRKELWVEYRITNKRKTPSHMTYRRILQQIISAQEFEQVMQGYHQQQMEKGQEIVFSMDGKTVRGTIPNGEQRGTHLLAIYVPQRGLVLAQVRVELKENEITAAPELLKQVSLEGTIVMADALHTQKAMVRQVVEDGGHYVLTAKNNQARTRWAIERLFVHEVCNLQKGVPLSKEFQMAVKTEKGHGRIEKRTIMTSTMLNDYLKEWHGLAQVFRIEHITWYSQMQYYRREIRYGITSLPPDKAGPEKLLVLNKVYWGIESGLHYRRDVTFQEDHTRLTVGDSGQNMAIVNNLVIGLCLSRGMQNLAKARRFFDAFPERALGLLTSAKNPSL